MKASRVENTNNRPRYSSRGSFPRYFTAIPMLYRVGAVPWDFVLKYRSPLPCPDASTRSPPSSFSSTHNRTLNRYPTIRIPIPTTPANVAIKRTLRTFRRMIISGRESPITDIMNASTVPSAAPFPRRACTTGMMLAALEYMGIPIATASGTDHHAPRHEILRHVAVDSGADGNPGQHVRPHFPDYVPDGIESEVNAVPPGD